MNSSVIKKNMSYTAVVLIMVYIITILIVLPDPKDDIVCKEFKIVVADSVHRHFVSPNDLRQLLVNKNLLPINKEFKDINLQLIEDVVIGVEVLRDAQCYKLNNGVVYLRVKQRIPKLRVIGTENYYVDVNRNVMKATYRTACRVPVVTGYVSQEMAKTELYDFVDWIEDNEFWNAHIEQIVVKSNRDIELVPNIGNYTILLGNLRDYERKLNKLQVFYNKVLNRIGWEQEYNELDLRFKGQVVCRRI